MSKVEEFRKSLITRTILYEGLTELKYNVYDISVRELDDTLKEIKAEQEELQKKADAYDEITNATADRDNLEEKIVLRLKEFLEDEYDCHGAEDFEPVIKHYAGTLIAIFEWHNKQTNMTYTYAKKIIEKETGVTIPHNFAQVWEARGQIAALMNTVSFELDKRDDDRSHEQFIWDSLEQSKPVEIPQFVAEWIEEYKGDYRTPFHSMETAKELGNNIGNWLYGNSTTDKDFENQEKYLQVWLDGNYKVKQEREWIVYIGGMYLKEPLGDTSDYTIKMTWKREYAYKFSDWNVAREHTSTLGGRIVLSTEEQE